jgi:hypothetical protein
MRAATSATGRRATNLVEHAKTIALAGIGTAVQKYAFALEREQEILTRLADMMIEVFAMESVLLRTQKMDAGEDAIAARMCSVYLDDAIGRIEKAAGELFAAIGGAGSQSAAALLGAPRDGLELNVIEERRAIARRLLQAGRYVTIQPQFPSLQQS